MAIVILGGLVTSTLLNLFVLPSLYLRFAKSRKERRTSGIAAAPQSTRDGQGILGSGAVARKGGRFSATRLAAFGAGAPLLDDDPVRERAGQLVQVLGHGCVRPCPVLRLVRRPPDLRRPQAKALRALEEVLESRSGG